mmetsp:Transcript_3798/g.5759  ORF Transcript_3798/g.5759 Transcript_3798/m.5759 type:complete len:195 (-) Transcript_3798:429-1013(-)|eukprot:CAMPEP_0184644798 /NCGR_PEP_ID=MMETSP0308-20130426/1440_1 /TAXON_ID=38269 /ORGANISM="Gloeochaete witrockiana, Strain SAG 46.84" /LENGTH=194 /DNA_ID=CAMNT_0027073505 /DNA_START=181 /DNA_END=765 /DNA_ORIENTATION=+
MATPVLSSMKEILHESSQSFSLPTLGLGVLLFVGIVIVFVIRRKISSSSASKDIETIIVGGMGKESYEPRLSFRSRVDAIEVTQALVRSIERSTESLSCPCAAASKPPRSPSATPPIMDSPSRRSIGPADVFSTSFVSVEPLFSSSLSGDRELVRRFLKDSVECSSLSPPELDKWFEEGSNEDDQLLVRTADLS